MKFDKVMRNQIEKQENGIHLTERYLTVWSKNSNEGTFIKNLFYREFSNLIVT